MADIFAEVDEIMRRERLAKFWKDHGPFMVALIVTVIAFTGALSAYRTWDDKITSAQTDRIIEIIDDKDFPGNVETEDLSRLRSSFRALLLLNAAGAVLEEGKTDEALGFYTRIMEDRKAPRDLQELASLMAVKIWQGQKENTKSRDELLALLAPIANDVKSPWRWHAKLEMAIFLAGQKHDYSAAIGNLNDILGATGLPASLYTRANSLKHLYSLQKEP